MEIKDLIDNQVGALVEFYNDSPACAKANELVAQVRTIVGYDAPIYRINVDENPREASLVRLETIPTIIIYRNHREEWRMAGDFPTAEVIANRLVASLDAPGAVNPLKGRKRS